MPAAEHAVENSKAHVTLLSGFLGAGKTTLLKEILSWQTDLSDTVVIVNEFGEVGIDGALLQNASTDVIELASGCICCTLSVDLMQCLSDIWQRFHPRRIFIESSGVADPTAVREVLNLEQLREVMVLEKIVTVLDADFWEAREAFGQLFYNQLEIAHLILLNKIDLIEADQIPQYLAELHDLIPDCQVVPTLHCRIDPETIWVKPKPKVFGIKPMQFYTSAPQSETDAQNTNGPQAAGHSVSAQEAGFKAFSFESEQPFGQACFEQFLAQVPFALFRIKGPVRYAEKTVLLNYVGGQAAFKTWAGEHRTRLAFIGWGVEAETVLPQLRGCLAAEAE